MFELVQGWLQRPNFIAFVILFLWGLYITVTHHNLLKKLIGLYLVQTSVIFFLVTTSAKDGATVPILTAGETAVQPETYVNPLPHVLTLTAIVVQVATLFAQNRTPPAEYEAAKCGGCSLFEQCRPKAMDRSVLAWRMRTLASHLAEPGENP